MHVTSRGTHLASHVQYLDYLSIQAGSERDKMLTLAQRDQQLREKIGRRRDHQTTILQKPKNLRK